MQAQAILHNFVVALAHICFSMTKTNGMFSIDFCNAESPPQDAKQPMVVSVWMETLLGSFRMQ